MKLGAASGGLADVDLDTLEAGLAAPYFLPRSLCFGRPSKPQSHWLYQSNLCETEDKAAIQFKFITGKGRDRTEQTILELRIGGGGMGAQTVFPGSTHESGELIAWEESSPIARAEGEDLKQRCARAAAAALIAGHFTSKGARHDAGLPWEVFSFGAGSAGRTPSCSSRPLRSPAASHARKSVMSERRRARHGTKPIDRAARPGGSQLSPRPSEKTSRSVLPSGSAINQATRIAAPWIASPSIMAACFRTPGMAPCRYSRPCLTPSRIRPVR